MKKGLTKVLTFFALFASVLLALFILSGSELKAIREASAESLVFPFFFALAIAFLNLRNE